MSQRLTKRLVDRVRTNGKETSYPDATLPGFELRVKPSGTKSYCIRYRSRSGRRVRETLGQHGAITLEQAREIAQKRLAEVTRTRALGAEFAPEVETVAELTTRYLEEYSQQHHKPDTQAGYRLLTRRYILPDLGELRIDGLTRRSIASWHRLHSRRSPTQANRMLAALKAILNWGEREELIADGAARCCKHIRKNPERPRERFLSTEELGRLGRAIDQAEAGRSAHPSAILGLRLLILTGCRRSEILKLTWPEVDFERRCLRLRDSKTGPKVVPLGSAALELLEKAPRNEGNPYVCAGSRPGSRYSNVEKPWRRIRSVAGLPDVRIHDLRHSFASVGVGAGIGLPIVGHILGHRQPATTARYAHFANEPVQRAAELLADAISRALSGGEHTGGA